MDRKYGIDIKWLAITSFEFRCGNTTVVSDPHITDCSGTDCTWENVENCDMILLSHGHYDHITDIPKLVEKFRPLILCGEQTAIPLAQWLNYTPSRIYPMNPNLELDFGDVKVKALYGRHTDLKVGFNGLCGHLHQIKCAQANLSVAQLQTIGSMEYRNFLLTLPNGTKILIWGNDPTVEQINICKAEKPDIAIIQAPATEEVVDAKADFVAKIGAKVLIPHHHDFHEVDDPALINKFGEAFLKRVPDGKYIAPVHGQWMHL